MEKNLKDRWDKLDSRRTGKLLKARSCSLITVPTILPPPGHSQSLSMYQAYSSVASRGVTSLASKILSVLIPLNDTPFFSFIKRDGREPSSEVYEYLSALSFQVYRKLISRNLREISYLAIQHLIVVGDVMILMEDDASFRVVGLDRYVVRRDVNGDILEAMYLEFISPDNTEDVDHYDYVSDTATQPGFRTVYVRFFQDTEGNWAVQKELDGVIIDSGYYTEPPFCVLRWATIDGEDYGRSHVEDVYADIASLEKYSKALIQGLLAGSTFFMGVDPSGITELDDVASASSGDWVPARKQDIFAISPSDTLNPQISSSATAVETMRKEVGSGFLLQSATMPSGDRVTATAIRALGNELESILGGTFSAIARDLFTPIIRRLVFLMIENSDIDPRMAKQFDVDSGLVDIEILTGLQALNRESDLTKLLQMGEMVRNLPPEAVSSFRWDAYARALITSLGFDPSNWVRSAEEIKAEQAAQAKAQQQAELQKILATQTADVAGHAARSDIDKTGGANIPPEAIQQAMQMFGASGGGGDAASMGQGQPDPMAEGMPQ